MAINIGDKIPAGALRTKTSDGITEIKTDELFGGKKVVVFAVPGAFTPTCSAKHLPSYVEKAADLKGKGVDAIACISVNDAFVMDAWGRDQKVGSDVMMLADGTADFTKALGLEMDASGHGLGIRSKRYAMVVEDGTVTNLFVEEPGQYEVSAAEYVLDKI